MGSIERRLEALESAQRSSQAEPERRVKQEVLLRLTWEEIEEYEQLFSAEHVSGEEPILLRIRELEEEVRSEFKGPAG